MDADHYAPAQDSMPEHAQSSFVLGRAIGGCVRGSTLLDGDSAWAEPGPASGASSGLPRPAKRVSQATLTSFATFMTPAASA